MAKKKAAKNSAGKKKNANGPKSAKAKNATKANKAKRTGKRKAAKSPATVTLTYTTVSQMPLTVRFKAEVTKIASEEVTMVMIKPPATNAVQMAEEVTESTSTLENWYYNFAPPQNGEYKATATIETKPEGTKTYP